MFNKRRVLSLMAALVLGASAAPTLAYQPGVIPAPASAAKPGRRGLFNDTALPTSSSLYGRKGAGISVAQGKRNPPWLATWRATGSTTADFQCLPSLIEDSIQASQAGPFFEPHVLNRLYR